MGDEIDGVAVRIAEQGRLAAVLIGDERSFWDESMGARLLEDGGNISAAEVEQIFGDVVLIQSDAQTPFCRTTTPKPSLPITT